MAARRPRSLARERVRLGTGRETDLRRRPPRLDQRRTVLIATNGQSTEKNYFSTLKQEPWVQARVGREGIASQRGEGCCQTS